MKKTGQNRKANTGFTLVELMVVVAIIAIISAIGYPSYQESVRKTNRADGLTTLMDTAQRLERCYTTYGGYDNASCGIQNGDKIKSNKGHYEVEVTSDETTFSLKAVALTDMQKLDKKCGDLTIDNTSKKSASGTEPTKCW